MKFKLPMFVKGISALLPCISQMIWKVSIILDLYGTYVAIIKIIGKICHIYAYIYIITYIFAIKIMTIVFQK